MNTLILKLGATGDVVRTSTLLHKLDGEVTWVTAAKNLSFIQNLPRPVRALSWETRDQALDRGYDLLINLEDTEDVGAFANQAQSERIYGALLKPDGSLDYTDDAAAWFDLSLISRFGREEADRLKLKNRRTYQDLVFSGLGFQFDGDGYVLPPATDTGLRGDVAISPVAGPVWPMKAWAHFDRLKEELEGKGLKVNVLPTRETLLEHLGDVQGHRCLVSGDSLPMHLALGSNVKCVSIFNCTSPWEIYEYGLQVKLVSPLLEQHFYQRTFDEKATTAVPYEDVLSAVLKQVG